MPRLTKDQQVKEITEGLALGLLAIGVESVPSGRPTLALAFNRAWKDWSKRTRYPSIDRETFPGDLFMIGTSKSEGRRGAFASWEMRRRATPYLTSDFDPEEAMGIIASDGVSPDAWKELAQHLVDAFEAFNSADVLFAP